MDINLPNLLHFPHSLQIHHFQPLPITVVHPNYDYYYHLNHHPTIDNLNVLLNDLQDKEYSLLCYVVGCPDIIFKVGQVTCQLCRLVIGLYSPFNNIGYQILMYKLTKIIRHKRNIHNNYIEIKTLWICLCCLFRPFQVCQSNCLFTWLYRLSA